MERLLLRLSINVTSHVPRSRLLRRAAQEGRAASCAAIPSCASGMPAARRAKRSTRWPSCCRRRVSTIAAASTPPTSTRWRCSARATASSTLEHMQDYTTNYLRAGGHGSLSRLLHRQLRPRDLPARAAQERHLLAAQPRHRRQLQRVQPHLVPQRDDLFQRGAAGARAQAPLRRACAATACLASGARSRCAARRHERDYEPLDESERLFRRPW